jgi:hypothetical protein
MQPIQYQMPTTYELTREVPDHEVLLVFNSDSEASEFIQWFEGPGKVNLETWRASFTAPD